MKCVKCGKTIDTGDCYCGYCGINQVKFTKYLAKVSAKIHKEKDKEYNDKVKAARANLKYFEDAKRNEICRITNNRWQSIGDSFSYNMIEGKVRINGQLYSFSDIKSAEIKTMDGCRIVTNTKGSSYGKSKKHGSLGGAVAGGLLFGPIGAVVGGSTLGSTNSSGDINQVSTSNQIPVCHHIGVNVNIKGFNTEIVLLSKTVDQSNVIYVNTINIAQQIVDVLRNLSSTTVSKKVLKPEEEKSVLDFDPQIERAAKELQAVVADKPNYDIPDIYFK